MLGEGRWSGRTTAGTPDGQVNHAKDNASSVSDSERSMFVVEDKAFFALYDFCATSTDVSSLTITELEDTALMSRFDSCNIIIDSGTTSHVHPHPDDFISLDTSLQSSITGISGKLSTKGRGTVSIMAKTSKTSLLHLHLPDAIYAPNANCSLLSVSRMDQANCRITFEAGHCIIQDTSLLRATAARGMVQFALLPCFV